METIIVQLPEPARPPEHGPGPAGRSGKPGLLHLGPGDVVDLGRGPAVGGGSSITLDDPGISRRAGQLEAAGDHWRLSNFSRSVSYVVENLEGAGEYITVAPGRLGAPVLFEFSRVVLPALTKTAASKVFAPQHAYLGERSAQGRGEQTVHPFALDPTAKYYLVLVALCEPLLRDPSDAALPGAGEIAQGLRPLESCRDLTRSAVNCHIGSPAFAKLRLDLGEDTGTPADGGRTGAKRARLDPVALRFGRGKRGGGAARQVLHSVPGHATVRVVRAARIRGRPTRSVLGTLGRSTVDGPLTDVGTVPTGRRPAALVENASTTPAQVTTMPVRHRVSVTGRVRHGGAADARGGIETVSVEFNHTIVLTRDREKSARFLARILSLEVGEPAGMFLPVTTANGVTLDFATIDADIPMQHYAFLVSEDEFGPVLARLVDDGIPIQADPHGRHPRRVNRNDGGHGVYFPDPAGHGLEVITRPYGTDPDSPLNGVTEEVPGAV